MLYTSINLRPVHRLHFAWTGWPTEGTTLPPAPTLDTAKQGWETDGLRLIAQDFNPSRVMLTFKAEPRVVPTQIAQRAKGRLQHAWRKSGSPIDFSRKVAIRSLGENITDVVESYIRDQLVDMDLADPRYRLRLAENAFESDRIDLDEPAETNSGRYWYNLHLVLVTCGRYRIGDPDTLEALQDKALRCARDTGLAIKSIALMPDHIHVALRGSPKISPLQIGILLQNATARATGTRLWQDNFYVGTFSEYRLGVVGRRATAI
jgi:REP element-mobilizing transposase RayT